MGSSISVESSHTTLLRFVLLTFIISWGFWSLPLIEAAGLASNPLSSTVARLFGAFGPSAAAIVLARAEGRVELRRLLGRFRRWRIAPRWYAVALLLPAAVSLSVTGISILLGHPVPDFSNPPVREMYPLPTGGPDVGLVVLFPIVFVQTLLLGSPMGEEIGWRGYALPRLQAGRSALRASLILGIVWGTWHLPLFLIPGDPLADTIVTAFLVGIVADSILFTWVFNNTDGSLVFVLLLHTSIILTDLFLSSAGPVPFLDPVLSWGLAVTVIGLSGRETLSRQGSR